MSTPPVKTVGDSGGRSRGEDRSRTLNYFEPAGRRATWYEDVTVDTQPSIHRHLPWGWPMHFEDGRATWSARSTQIRMEDWYGFRDPGQLWERPYYQEGSGYEREIESAVSVGRAAKLFADLSPEWVEFLRHNLQVPAFVEHGLWLALAVNARDCLSDTLAHACAIEAGMKQRQAQALVLYGMDLETEFGEFSTEAAKERFMSEAAWQPARRYLEKLRTITDWVETLVAVNACFEPIVGSMLRRELLLRSAVANNDAVTPGVLRPANEETSWATGWTGALLALASEEPAHGADNAEVLRGWLEDWRAQAREAADALAPLFAELPTGSSFEAARASGEREHEALLEQAPALAPDGKVSA